MRPTKNATERSHESDHERNSLGRRSVLRRAGAVAVGSTLALSAGSAEVAGADGSDGAAPRSAWTRQYGGDGEQEANALVRTSDGGYALAGRNEYRAWLVKLRPDGEVAWQQTLDAGGILSLVEAHDGGFVLGTRGGGEYDDTSVTILVKVDASGVAEWRAGIPFPSGFDPDQGELLPDAVVQAEGGGYVVAGGFEHNEGSVAWVAKVEAGDVTWLRWVESEPHPDLFWPVSQFNAVTPAPDGGYVAAGYTAVGRVEDFLPDLRPWAVKVGEDGELAWTRTYRDEFGVAEAIVPREDGGYVVGGTTTTEPIVGTFGEAFLLWTDESGDPVRYRTYENGDLETLDTLVRTDRGYSFAGQTGQYAHDGWVVEVDESGDRLWDLVYDYDCQLDIAALVRTDPGYAFAGTVIPFPRAAGNADAWLVKIDGQ